MPTTPTDPSLTVFVVDDDADIRTSLVRGLSKRGYNVEAHDSAKAFLEVYHAQRLGCLVLDYGIADMNGLELQRHLNARNLPIPIIFITGHGGVRESVQAIKGGAIDFLEKPFRQADLIERIETAFEMARVRETLDVRSQEQRARFGRLTARELEIVNRIIAAPSASSSKEIAAHLGISPRTVDHHRARILEKLGVKSLAELIALANG